MSRRPNVIYILGDDQRAELLGCMGHPLVQTPHLDQLAREGTLFTQARCTSALCTPSRACHYTGRWERAHGVNFNSDTALSPTAWDQGFVGQLKQAGYWCGWIGKNHVPAGLGGYGSDYFENWFDCWWGNHNHSSFYPKELPKGMGDIYRAAMADTQAEVFGEGAMNILQPQQDFLDRCTSHFSGRPENGQPFCLCLTFNLPHGAATSTMELRPSDDDLYRSAYRNRQQEIQLPETWAPWASCEPKLPREIYNHRWIPDYDYVKRPQELRERIVRQCQVITGVDRVIGRLRQSLEAIGEADNTIIIFSTDHGLFFGEHGLGGKALLYEPALRIPLIIHDPRPGRRKGQRSDAMVAVPDLAPTVLDLCGIDATPGMQGTSIAPILTGSTTPIRDELFVENLYDDQNYPRCQGLIGERFKYLSYFKRHEDPAQDGRHLRATLDDYESCRKTMSADEAPVHEELFDLNEDPGECHNLAGYADQQDRLAHMRQRCRAAAARLLPGGKPDTVVRTLPT